MALPKITQPEFEITLPVIKKKVKFRPFLVKEEKLLLVGKEGGAGDQLNSIKQVLTNVVISPKNFDPSDLTVTDIEYLFMHLRGKSVNNIVKLKYKDKEDEQLYDFELDINEIEPTIDPNRSYELSIGDLTMLLKDPTMGTLQKADMNLDSTVEADDENQAEKVFGLLAHCLVKVWDANEVYDDFTIEEAKEFIRGMDIKSFEQVQNFFNTAPKLEHTLEYKNSLGNDRSIVLRGISDFF